MSTLNLEYNGVATFVWTRIARSGARTSGNVTRPARITNKRVTAGGSSFDRKTGVEVSRTFVGAPRKRLLSYTLKGQPTVTLGEPT